MPLNKETKPNQTKHNRFWESFGENIITKVEQDIDLKKNKN